MGVIEPSERAEGEEDEIAWDPAWDDEDEELDTAAAQIAEDEALGFTGASGLGGMTTTGSLMTLKGSLASILGATGSAGLYAELLAKLELAAGDDDRDDYAALVIQRAYRSTVRRRGAAAHRAAVRAARALRIQSVYRGHLRRRVQRALHRAAARIQGLARGAATRRRLRAARRERRAGQIQRWYRACVARDLVGRARRTVAAAELQRVFRGHMGRLIFQLRRRTRAAIHVERCVRGHRGRRQVRREMELLRVAKEARMRRAAVLFQALLRGHLCRERVRRRMPALRLARRIRMCLRIQRNYRCHAGRVRFRVQAQLRQWDVLGDAIRPIQALGRGHIVRQRARDERDRKRAAEAARLAALILQARRERAATTIQRGWLRWAVQELESLLHRLAGRIQLWYRLRRMGVAGREYRRLLKAKATRIQAVVAGHLARRRVRALRRLHSCTRIQAVFRGHRGRAAWRERRRFVRDAMLEEERRRRAAWLELERQIAVIKQSARGQLEVFASQSFAPAGGGDGVGPGGGGGGGGRADPQGRPMQIVPHYMKEAALNESRMRRPTVSGAVLEAPEVAHLPLGLVGTASIPQPRGDALGWAGPQPRLDPFFPARTAASRAPATTASSGLHAGSEGPSVEDPIPATLTRENGDCGGRGRGRGGGDAVVVHKTLGIGAGRPWATISVPARELPPLHQEISTGPAATQLVPSYMRPQARAAAGAAGPLHPSLPGPLRALGATAPLRPVGGNFARDDTGAALIPPERAHMDRIAKIEARMAKKKRPKSAFAAAAEAAAAAAEAEAAAAAAAAYGQDLVRNQAVRRRWRLDEVKSTLFQQTNQRRAASVAAYHPSSDNMDVPMDMVLREFAASTVGAAAISQRAGPAVRGPA